jgi:hypothetical protein
MLSRSLVGRGSNPNGSWPDLQRAVTINVFGKPYFPPPSTETKVVIQAANLAKVSYYPTQTFSSRWNCVLDLTAQQGPSAELLDAADPSRTNPSSYQNQPHHFLHLLCIAPTLLIPQLHTQGDLTPHTAGSKRSTDYLTQTHPLPSPRLHDLHGWMDTSVSLGHLSVTRFLR